MSENSPIEWTESTWNPVTGCSPISIGCNHCYALRMAKRLQAMGNKNYINGFDVSLHAEMLSKPLNWKKSRLIFVNSMSDLFHEKVPFQFIESVFDVMKQAKWHTFQILTKRSDRLLALASKLEWPSNVWFGVTVESEAFLHRIDHIRNIPASVRFISCEPLLTPLDGLILKNIDWVIVGGESGSNARPMHISWVESIQLQCAISNVPFFFKQWGGVNKKKNGRLLHGNQYSAMPLKFSPLRIKYRTKI
jgi:protein gp37